MAVRDRLQELQNVQNDGKNRRKVSEVRFDIVDSKTQSIEEVFAEVTRIRKWIDEIREHTRMMKKLYSDSTYHTSRNFQEEFDNRMSTVSAIGRKVFGALKELEAGCDSGSSAACRIRRLQYAALRQDQAQCLREYDALLERYRYERMAILREQAKLTKQLITTEECQELLDDNLTSLFVDNIITETQEAKQALQDLKTRHNEFVKIENSLREVRYLFVDMAAHIERQQHAVDTVEYYANQATDHVDSGAQQLSKAEIKRKRYRKKKTCILVAVALVFLIILVVALFV